MNSLTMVLYVIYDFVKMWINVDKLFAKLNDVKWEEKQIFRKGQKIYLQAQSEPRPALPGIFRSVGRPQTNRLPTMSLR